MKLIAGSLHGAVDCSALHDNLDDDDEPNCSNASSPHSPSIPTLTEVARKAAKSEGMQLDELQHIACETICCTFLLQLINERADADFGLESQLREALASNNDDGSMKLLTKELKARGGQDQLLMFLTGPAGSGKSEVLKISRRFLFEFCFALGMLWNDWTFS